MLPMVCDSSENPLIPSVDGVYSVVNHPFKIDTVLYIGDAKEMAKCLKRKFGTSLDGVDVDFRTIDGVTIPCSRRDGSQFILVYIPKFDWSAAKFAVLTHEIVHSSVFILKMSGVHNSILEGSDANDSDDECLAHLVDSQTESLVSKLVRKAAHSPSKRR